jgi:hypothetical protein
MARGAPESFRGNLCSSKTRRRGTLEIGEDVWAITLFDQDAPKLTSELVAVHSKVAPEIEWIPQLGLSRHCPINALIRWLAPFLELALGGHLTWLATNWPNPSTALSHGQRQGTTSQGACLRQSGIDEELFDVISGFEALSVEEK